MKTHNEYISEKKEYSYKLYKKHRIFKKVKAVILDEDNQVYLIKYPDNGVVIPGGGVEDGETLRQAVTREALEETGLKVEPIKILCKNFYTCDSEYNGTKFVSRRVEYYYLCKYIEKISNVHGIEGEFEKDITISKYPIEKLKRTKISKRGIAKIKKYIELINQNK